MAFSPLKHCNEENWSSRKVLDGPFIQKKNPHGHYSSNNFHHDVSEKKMHGGGDGLGLWVGNPIQLGCDDPCTITNVLTFIELKNT